MLPSSRLSLVVVALASSAASAQEPAPFQPASAGSIFAEAVGALKQQGLPPPPGERRELPPPPGQGRGLPPPPGDRGGNLPPPPRRRDDRLPPPPSDGRGHDGHNHDSWDRRGYDRRGEWSRRSDTPFRAFERAEDDLRRAEAEYRSAPGGSWQEQRADRDRRDAYERGVAAARAISQTRVNPESLERFARDCDSKYRSAPGGSLSERMYDSARRDAWTAVDGAWRWELDDERFYEEVIRLGERFDAAYRSAPGGSVAERTYDSLRSYAWTRAAAALDLELSRPTDDFRTFERLGEEFQSAYRAAPGGSRKESFYDRARRRAFTAAAEAFGRYARYADRWELRNLENEYDGKYRAAPGGSPAESYYRRVRDEARSH